MKLKTLIAPILMLVSTALYAQSECASPIQPNGAVYGNDGMIDLSRSQIEKLWECPSLQSVAMDDDGNYPFTHKLKRIDFVSGSYVCDYNYKQSGQYKQSCEFSSQLYKGFKKLTQAKLKGSLNPDGTPKKGLFDETGDIDFEQDFNYLHMHYFPPQMLQANIDFNRVRKEIIEIENGITFDPTNPNRRAEAIRQRVKEGYQTQFTNIESDLTKLQDIVNRHLINPYLHPYSSDIRKGYTLSNFVAGLITLDPTIINGYDPNNGEILIQQEWKTKAARIETEKPGSFSSSVSSVWNSILNFIGLGTSNSEEADTTAMEVAKKIYGGDVQFKIYSYAKVFEEKLWGFYYLIQERFDIGYSILASSLLLIFGMWFLFSVGAQEGMKYLVSKQTYEAKMDETAYIKMILILLTLGIFFVSIPSGINDKVDNTGSFQPNAMKKNYTIAKSLIRKTASWGASTATMFSDLGLSAFSQYIVKRQMMLSVDEIKKGLEKSVEDIYMYSPALKLRSECKAYYNSPSDEAFFNSIDDANFPINESWKDSEYATSKNISALSYEVCKTAYKLYAMMPYQIGNAVATAKEQLRKADGRLSEATFLMTYNNIALEEKMGWTSAFSYPLEYFILKKNDMFLSEEMDQDRIAEESEKYMSTLFKDGDDMARSSFFGDSQDNIAWGSSKTMALVNNMFINNILPMFSDIQKGLYGYFEKLYESKYQLWLQEKDNENSGSKLSKTLRGFTDKIGSTPMGVMVSGLVKSIFGNLISYSTLWHTGLLLLSYYMAIQIWKLTFAIIFTILISMMFLVSFIMYFFDLLVHFTTSLFMFVWAFAKPKTGYGEGKLKEWMKNTILIVYLKPSILIFGGFIFIFLYELMVTLYQLVFTSVTSNLMASVSLMSTANSKTGLFDSISAYSTVMAMQTVAEAVLDLFGIYLAYVAILKIPAIIFKKLGADSDDATHNQSITEQLQSKQERNTNPAAS